MSEKKGRTDGTFRGGRTDKNSREEPSTLPTFDLVVILPDGREAAKVGNEYYLLKRGKPDFKQPVDPES
jgi:hypothetical protein